MNGLISWHDHCDWTSSEHAPAGEPSRARCVNASAWPVHLADDPWRGGVYCDEHALVTVRAGSDFVRACGCRYCMPLLRMTIPPLGPKTEPVCERGYGAAQLDALLPDPRDRADLGIWLPKDTVSDCREHGVTISTTAVHRYLELRGAIR
jgi:hypothetical protein